MEEKKKAKKVKAKDLPLDQKKTEETLKAIKGGVAKKKPAKK